MKETTEHINKYRINLVKEVYSDTTGGLLERVPKTVAVEAPSLCEAIVKAVKSNRDYSYVSGEEICG